jgi:hypothetical protein
MKIDRWQKINLQGFFDTTGLADKFQANVVLNYENKTGK